MFSDNTPAIVQYVALLSTLFFQAFGMVFILRNLVHLIELERPHHLPGPHAWDLVQLLYFFEGQHLPSVSLSPLGRDSEGIVPPFIGDCSTC